MKSAIIAIVFLLIGGAVGGFLGLGMGSITGVVAGSQAGACLAVETAKEQGLLTSEQVDQVISGAIGKIKDKAAQPTDTELKWVGSEADCAAMVAELQKAVQGQ